MLAILSALLGLVSSFAPKAIDLFKDKQDKNHELEVMKLQMQAAKEGAQSHLDEVVVNAAGQEAVERQKAYTAELKYTGWYSASVRPTVTYLFVLVYIVVKISMIYNLMHPAASLPWQDSLTFFKAISLVWGDEDVALFSWVMAFWFGDRAQNPRAQRK